MNNEDLIKTAAEYGKFTVEARRQFETRYREEIVGLFQYVQNLMAIMGVIAGFGFTAFEYVTSIWLFFLGEAFVVGSILYLVFKVKGYLLGQPKSTEDYLNHYSQKSNQIKQALLKKDTGTLTSLVQEFSQAVNDTADVKKIETTKVVNGALGISLLFSITGIILIFASFFLCF